MNHCVPDWGMGDDSMIFHDLASASHKKPTRPENELVELMWQNGPVVMHCQANRKNTSSLNEIKQCQKPEPAFKCGGNQEISAGTVHGEESTSWLQFPDDSLEKEFYSDLFCVLPTTESGSIDKLKDVAVDGVKFAKCGGTEENSIGTHSTAKLPNNQQFDENVMPPPKLPAISPFPQAASANNSTLVNFSHFSKPKKAHPASFNGPLAEKSSGSKIQGTVGHTSSMATKSSSICGSNQVQNPFDVSWSNTVTVHSTKVVEEESQARFSSGTLHSDMLETALTSSSGGSGCSYGRTALHSASMKSHKRKGRDADESECQSEEAEYESNGTDRVTQRSVPARRSRAAEVHNLSERRRRDRINEKMKALQELIPHCNKTDKASMLDEAIEYLKSLQVQVQMMWMGGGMTPMLFPGMQHYMSRMGLSVGHVPMPSMQNPILFPRVPLVNSPVSSNPDINQASLRPSPGLTPVSFQNQLQNAHIPESYSRYLGFQHMQALPQAMNLYAYGSQLAEQNQATEVTGSGGHYDGGAIPKNFPNSRTCEDLSS